MERRRLANIYPEMSAIYNHVCTSYARVIRLFGWLSLITTVEMDRLGLRQTGWRRQWSHPLHRKPWPLQEATTMILNSARSLGFKQRSRTGGTSRNIPCCIRSNTPAPGPCVCLVYFCLSDRDKTGLVMTQRVCVAQCVCHCLSIKCASGHLHSYVSSSSSSVYNMSYRTLSK